MESAARSLNPSHCWHSTNHKDYLNCDFLLGASRTCILSMTANIRDDELVGFFVHGVATCVLTKMGLNQGHLKYTTYEQDFDTCSSSCINLLLQRQYWITQLTPNVGENPDVCLVCVHFMLGRTPLPMMTSLPYRFFICQRY